MEKDKLTLETSENFTLKGEPKEPEIMVYTKGISKFDSDKIVGIALDDINVSGVLPISSVCGSVCLEDIRFSR